MVTAMISKTPELPRQPRYKALSEHEMLRGFGQARNDEE
jgi:hypothetical protein